MTYDPEAISDWRVLLQQGAFKDEWEASDNAPDHLKYAALAHCLAAALHQTITTWSPTASQVLGGCTVMPQAVDGLDVRFLPERYREVEAERDALRADVARLTERLRDVELLRQQAAEIVESGPGKLVAAARQRIVGLESDNVGLQRLTNREDALATEVAQLRNEQRIYVDALIKIATCQCRNETHAANVAEDALAAGTAANPRPPS